MFPVVLGCFNVFWGVVRGYRVFLGCSGVLSGVSVYLGLLWGYFRVTLCVLGYFTGNFGVSVCLGLF